MNPGSEPIGFFVIQIAKRQRNFDVVSDIPFMKVVDLHFR